MGSADIIPGVSGGTVALITGIYERLIYAIKTVNLKFIPYFFKGLIDRNYFSRAKENIQNIDVKFLLPLVVGITTAFLLLARLIEPLLTYYPTYAYTFFFGLILSSSWLVYKQIKKINITMIIVTSLGFIVAFLTVGLDAIQTSHSIPIIFISGIITACAMILPGISGAFILWFLGQYEYMLHALNNLKITTILVYVIGALLGILAFSHVLSYAIKRYRVLTLSFLLGLMVGALRKPAEIVIAQPDNIVITISSGLLGIFIVYMFSSYQFIFNKKM